MNLKIHKINLSLQFQSLGLVAGLFSLLILLYSCGDTKIKGIQYQNFGTEGIVPEQDYVFYPFQNIDKPETNKPYEISLVIRISDLCRIKELPLNIETGSPLLDSIYSFNLKVNLYNDSDLMKGKGNMGISEISVPLFSEINFDSDRFISLSTPEKETKGIISLGIISTPKTLPEK